MSHPHSDSIDAVPPAQSKTLFVVEGRKTALLYTNERGKESTRRIKIADPHAALAWCIAHRAGMVFTLAALPEHN